MNSPHAETKPQMEPTVITIDGPAGTGKSTVARELAARLGFEFLDTGAMYRAVAWRCLQENVAPGEKEKAVAIAAALRFEFVDHQMQINGELVGDEIRTAEVSQLSSVVAAHPEVRFVLVEQQQKLGARHSLVTEGRDQGTVVFPSAAYKFFLTADPFTRAQRRFLELQKASSSLTLEQILQEQTERDARDTSRAISPLKPAEDAQVIDTSLYCLEEVLELLENTIRNPK